jgi:zinc transporter
MATAFAPAYRSDHSGLIWGYLFSGHSPGRPIATGEAVDWVSRSAGHQEDGFVWLHFDLANAATERCLRERLRLSDAFFEALHEDTLSTRIEHVGESLIAVVNDVLYDFAFEPSHLSTLWLNVDRRMVISVRRKPLRSVDRLRAAVVRGDRFRSTTEVMVHLLRDQADVLVQIMRRTTTKIDRIEDDLLAGRLEHKRENLGALRRVLVRLQRLLAPEPAALFRLLNRPPSWLEHDDVRELRQATEEFATALTDLSGLLERIRLLQEEIAAEINERNSRSLFLLTIFTVLALPINIIAGLFGMNVGGIPLAQSDAGFWIIAGIVIAFTAGALFLVFGRRNQ